MIATRPSSTERKTHACAKHCWKPSVFKHVVRCACYDREACFNPYKLSFNRTILPDRRPHPLGRRRKTSSSSLDWTKACSTSEWHTSRSSSQAIALNKCTQELETVGANVSPKSIPSRCLNPRATSLDFALLTQPNSSWTTTWHRWHCLLVAMRGQTCWPAADRGIPVSWSYAIPRRAPMSPPRQR